MSFIRTGFRELTLKVRRQRTRMALRHEKRILQKSEVALGREGVNQAGNFPELRTEIVALKKLEQEQREVTVRISQIEEGLKHIEGQRQQNAKEQATAVHALEEEKKPILQRRDAAKAACELCDRELSTVERRLQENDTADRELLKKLSELQAQVPPPEDLEKQTEVLSLQRVHLPGERAEIARARQGSAEACRAAREKLGVQQAELEAIDQKIAAVREEFESKDRALNESSRAQQDALKEARAQHQTVEERKNPAYLNIGRHLGSQGIAPPNAPHLLEDVQKRRHAVEKHSQHKEELAVLSSQIDKQELRKFYFSIASILVLLAIILPLVFQTPARRDWLPQETDAILAVNTQQLQRDELPKRWEKEKPEEWQALWAGLIGNAQMTPAVNLTRDSTRVTRALAGADGKRVREFVLVHARDDVSPVLRALEKEEGFTRRSISGLPVWARPDFALARVGPKTLAVGAPSEVEELVRVRLGIRPDLKISGTLINRFQALDVDVAVRMISSDPPSLARYFAPIFSRPLLDATQLIGLGLSLGNPVKAHLILKTKSDKAAADLAQNLKSAPERWLRLQDSDLLFYTQPPDVTQQGTTVEIRCDVPENCARLLLLRIAKTNAAPMAAAR